MRRFSSLMAMAIAAVLGTSAAAQAQQMQTPLASPVEITGRSGGSQSSSCGNINPNAGQRVNVSEDFASLSFEVESRGNYTLLIQGPDGFSECVFAHNYDGGTLRAPGLLNRGEYQIFVGDRNGESHPYTLSISQ